MGIGSACPYHGNRTDQFKKTAARIRRVTSVTTALPFWKKIPATAGNKARPKGAECQCDSSFVRFTSFLLAARGKSMSSVDDRIEFRASDTVSDKVELRR